MTTPKEYTTFVPFHLFDTPLPDIQNYFHGFYINTFNYSFSFYTQQESEQRLIIGV